MDTQADEGHSEHASPGNNWCRPGKFVIRH